MENQFKLLHRLSGFAVFLALVVITLGAWVRLSDAGLGCPDWPGCYGLITWPSEDSEIQQAESIFPDSTVEVEKAWKEVIHRYFAGTLGILVVILAWLTWRSKEYYPNVPTRLAFAIIPVIVLQALFGMWTVTLKLLPWVVTTHLLGGMLMISLLFWLRRTIAAANPNVPQLPAVSNLRPLALTALVILTGQIFLGGWVSSNYAALACLDFPQCQQQWWPATDFNAGFKIWREIGVDYEGGILDQAARNAIHITHRIGALVAALVIGWCGLRFLLTATVHRVGILILSLLTLQIILGVNNIVHKLPLINAVAHNGVAAILLLAILNALWHTRALPADY